mmetsp:Transcript_116805/g.162192  ORF Transcript_116805/g.162192 Transcript_116805/m.162192 type:complete len:99 (+) Transcript_116805:315-611(+)
MRPKDPVRVYLDLSLLAASPSLMIGRVVSGKKRVAFGVTASPRHLTHNQGVGRFAKRPAALAGRLRSGVSLVSTHSLSALGHDTALRLTPGRRTGGRS